MIMATLPPDPYAPDPLRKPDGTPLPDDQPASLPGSDDPEPPAIMPGDPGNAPSDSPGLAMMEPCHERQTTYAS